jgi:hypothetical protein
LLLNDWLKPFVDRGGVLISDKVHVILDKRNVAIDEHEIRPAGV